MRALLGACSTRSSTGLRARALIVLLYRSGLRLAEALALHPGDVDLEAGTVRVLDGKGHRPRTVGIDPGAAAILERWSARRRELGLGGRHPLLCTLGGGHLGTSYVRRLLPRLGARAGINRRVHAHGLRHAHAAELSAEGFPTALIRDQLGHASLATTDRYLRHIAPAELIGAVASRAWHP